MAGSEELAGRKGQLDARRALLLKKLQAQKGRKEAENRIQPRAGSDPLPLSYTQQRVWFLQQLYPHNRAYNMSEAWRIRGPLDVKTLRQALQELVQRHASLRTRFLTAEDEPRQHILPEVEMVLSLSDLSHLAPPAQEELIPQMVVAEGNYAFDLSQAPLFRASLIRLADEDHILQLVLHHIITDEWSNDLIWRDLSQFYTKFAGVNVEDLPDIPIQYADYALWQREQVDSGAWDGQMDYWQRRLSGELPLLQLPFDHPRGSIQSLRGGIVRRMLAPDLLARMKDLSQEAGTSLNMVLLAAYQALLQRISGQEDILVGTPIANRQRPETKDVMGMFINTAVIRSFLAPELTFKELLAQVQETFADALSNQDLPFDLLVQAMHPDRDLSYNPLFQCMFVFRTAGVERSLPGLTFAPIHVDRGVSKFDLTLFAGEDEGRLYSAIEYSSDLFDAPTSERMLDHWQNLLRALVANPDQPLRSLSFLGSDEREMVIQRFNKKTVPLASKQALHEQIAAQAVRTPQAVAVIDEHEQLTYAELDARANRLAQRLVRQGIRPGTPIGLFVERSAAMITAILGILKTGGAYLPLAPDYPQERIAFALQDTGAPVVLCQAHLQGRLPETEAGLVVLEEILANESGWSGTAPETGAGLDDLAYIIYTSGSTGTPKGVMVTHGNLLASTAARHLYYEEPVRRFLLLSSFAFDSSVAGIFWTLASGGALVLPAPDEEKDVQKLAGIIAREQVTHTLALPSLYRLLLSYAPPEQLASLRSVIVAGEACPPDLGEMHYQRLPQATLYNEYGPTEATVWCSVYRLPRIGDSSSVPIGRPIANAQLYILDAEQQPVPIGVPGELYVGGAGVTPGYWNNPQLTAARFPTLDWLEAEQARVYRTGDLARWRADGQIEFLGRVDNQVKIRGFRIEPEEIEAQLIHLAAVKETAVVAVDSERSPIARKILVAYVVMEDGSSSNLVDSAKLRAYLGERLPEYMVPAHIVFLSGLPRTPNGKLDPSRLPTPEIESDRAIVPPRTPSERKLAQIWAEILNLSAVSIEDKFFALGGDSIMSIQVIARARQEGLILTPRQMFEEQTIARLAAVAETAAALEPAGDEAAGPLPLTPIQHWFFAQPLVDAAHWNQAGWFEAPRGINRGHLNEALADVIAHHPLLRARFCPQGDGWQQEIMPEAAPPEITVVSLAEMDSQAQDEAMLATANDLHDRLNLSEAPLLRGALFDLGQQRSPRLLLIIHHLVVDAVSWHLLANDLAAAYEQRAAGKRAALVHPPASYAQWARSLVKLAQSDKLKQELPYWRAQGVANGRLPRDVNGGGANTEGRARRLVVSLPSEHTALLLSDVHAAYHTRIDDLLLTALVRATAKWTGRRTLLLTLERHGRESFDPRLDVAHTVGWFTALFPLALTINEGDDPGADIRAIKEQLRAVPRNGAGFGVLRFLAEQPVRQELASLPQPEILFNYLGQAGGEQGNQALNRVMAGTGQAYGAENERAHLLDINARVTGGQLVFNWQYAPDYFQAGTIQKLAEATGAELSLLIDHCLQVEQSRHTPSDFPLAGVEQADLDELSDLLDGLG